jgi:hypothetical protein
MKNWLEPGFVFAIILGVSYAIANFRVNLGHTGDRPDLGKLARFIDTWF